MICPFAPRQSGIRRTPQVRCSYNVTALTAHASETLTAALLRGGISRFRSPARGMFCCMGLCQEGMVLLESRGIEACRVAVTEGLVVHSLDSRA